MKVENKRSESDGLESILDHVERRCLFGDEKYSLAVVQGPSEEVCDRLGLACSGRSLKHERLARHCLTDCSHLGAIRRDG